MHSKALLLAACSCLLLFTAARMVTNERAAIIDSAIKDVKEEFSVLKPKTENILESNSQRKMHSFKMATAKAMAQGKASLMFERMIKVAEKRIIHNNRQVSLQDVSALAESLAMELFHKPGSVLTKQEIAKIYQESECAATIATPGNCNELAPRKHRTADGTCNNLISPTLGAANTRLRRLIPSAYENGISRPRGFLQNRGSPLIHSGPFEPPNPSPRIASLGIVRDIPVNDTDHTHLLMQWGQFLDHDITAIPENEPRNCPTGCEITEEEEGRCYPFPVTQDDKTIRATSTNASSNFCHPFRRSLGTCPTEGEGMLPREQQNMITHFIDGSMIYHHDQTIQRSLIRNTSSDSGLLRVGPPVAGTIQPSLPDADIIANPGIVGCPDPSPPCFLTGDSRGNEHTALTTMHTLWVREHNRIARFLRQNNPNYSGDKIFLITREIVASEIQKITYEDYLPIILGDSYSSLIPKYTSYDNSIDPSIPNAFATAAYRFGHSQIQPFFERLNEAYTSIPAGPLSLVDAFFNTSHYRNNGGADPILRGLLSKPARQVDEYLNTVLTNHLFANDASSPGLDLAALNIQRGRDHGLATYLTWKQWAKTECNIESDFQSELTEIRFLQTYGSLNDVDLFVGGLAERPLPGGLVGATFACIFSKAFIGLRNGDRFFYKNSDPQTAIFSEKQRDEIKKSSLSRVICDNSDGITEIQPNAFLASQPQVACTGIPSMDLSVWNAVPPPTANLCYIKVRSRAEGSYYAFSQRFHDIYFHFHRERIHADRTVCYPIKCPRDNHRVTLAVVGPKTRTSCAPVVNSNLPVSKSRSARVYYQDFTTDEIDSRFGVYGDRSHCVQGKPVALNYDCNSPVLLAHQQQGDVVTDLNTDLKGLKDLVSDDEKKIIDEVVGGNSNVTSSKDELVHLMKELITEMTSESDVKGAEKMKAMKTPLLSELELSLKKLE